MILRARSVKHFDHIGTTLCESPMHLGPSGRTYVHFYHNIFLRIGTSVFFTFCMKLRDHKYSKLTESDFWGKFSLAQKWAKKSQNGANCPFACYYNIFLRIGLFFDGVEFFGKILACLKVGQKVQNDPICSLSVTTAFFSRSAH